MELENVQATDTNEYLKADEALLRVATKTLVTVTYDIDCAEAPKKPPLHPPSCGFPPLSIKTLVEICGLSH